jgi:hypothetical protein
MRGRTRWRFGVLALGATVGLAGPAAAEALPPVPQHGDAVHLGVASCAGSTCHGGSEPATGSNVLLNEAVTWQERDKHARAYTVLLDEESKSIARKLGLGDPQNEKICLDCHADNVPKDRRGPNFQLTDGVGCEACHGGAKGWIGVHTVVDNESSHARNVAAGLYPTEDPRARAKLCLSCHFGDDTKFVDHRLMGAGHPRLTFELDTFTAIEPAHFEVDDDYRERKDEADGVQTWAIGQAMALAQTLDAVLDPRHGRDGIFPEPVLFDCHACHRPMSAGRWQERSSLGLGPGVVRFNDANLIMLRLAAGVVSPRLGQEIAQRGRALHQASQKGQQEWRAAAEALRASSLKAVDAFAAHRFDERTTRALLDAVVREGNRGEYVDYVAAEQTTMALGALIQKMKAEGWIGEDEYARVETVMKDMYDAVQEDERYRPTVHLDALERLQAAAR